MKVIIDDNSGFCFGVVYAIEKAETYLNKDGKLYCLGDIVHNDEEVKRLSSLGLKTINRDELENIKDAKVLIRAHGEPPETYKTAAKNNLTLIDATCPVVLKLQVNVRKAYDSMKQKNGQVVIFGKEQHAEVIGLRGQTKYEAIVIKDFDELDKIDFTRPVALFAQTTKNLELYYKIAEEIKRRMLQAQGREDVDFEFHDTVCRQVSHRDRDLPEFCKDKDVVLFISGKKSSNGRMLYEVCKKANPNAHFVSSVDEIDLSWFSGKETVGICGATSTPQWLMQNAKAYLEANFGKD